MTDEPSLIGATLDRKYKLVLLLGEGGMGSVYQAERTDTSERVAVKVIHSRLLGRDSTGVHRFRREARTAGSINSEHIVKVLDSGTYEAKGLLYLVMEYLQGEDVQHLIDRLGPLEPMAALRIAAQALMGLSKAHEMNIVHRDIKPANLFLSRREDGRITVKLLDFGIAKIKADPLSAPHTTGLTTTSGFLGSPLYMSPEQMRSSRNVDHRADLWSLGSALYCLLTGSAPYHHAESISELIFAILSAPPPPLHKLAPWVAPEVAKVVHGALKLKPEERYPSAAAMLDALQPLLPDGFALREDLLVPVSEEQRAAAPARISSLPPSAARRMVVHLDTTKSLARDEGVDSPSATTNIGSVGGALASPGDARLAITREAAVGFNTTAPIVREESADPFSRASNRDEGVAKSASETPLNPIPISPKRLRQAGESAVPAPAPQVRPWARALSAVILVAVISVIGVTQLRSPPPPMANPGTSAALAERPPAPPAYAVPTASSGTALTGPIQHVKLEVFPKDASVEVDGVAATARDGMVEIAGTVGSLHRVRVFKTGMKELPEVEVRVTAEGASPAKVELSPLAKGKPGPPRPAPIVTKSSPTPAEMSAPVAPPPKPTSSDDDIAR